MINVTMKMKYKILILLLSIACMCGCDSATTAVGGYSKTRRLSDAEREMFTTVTSSIEGVEYSPMNVATQVVAGTNYRFLCKARETKGSHKRFYAAIVIHQPLPGQGEPHLLSIQREER